MLIFGLGMEAKKAIELSEVVPLLERSETLFGTDELNLCEFPLAACGNRAPDCKTLTFEDDIFDEGNQQPVHRKLVIAASDAFGLPTPADSDVLLVLMHLTRLSNGFSSPTVRFKRYQIVKFLGWNQSGRSYQRLDEAFNRWASVTLFYNKAWWDRDGKSWRSKSFHVLETVDLRGRNDGDDGESTFTWNPVIFQSFVSNNIRRLDLNAYFALKLPAARQAYRFLDKRFHRAANLEMELRRFACEHVGLSRNYDNAQLRRKLQPAIEELESIGFLKPLSIEKRYRQKCRGEWHVILTKNSKIKEDDGIEASPASQLIEKLVERGVHTATAAEVVAGRSVDYVEEKIALHDSLVKHRDGRAPKNPAGYLVTAIRDDYPVPPELRRKFAAESGSKSKTQAKKSFVAPAVNLAEERERKRREAAKDFLGKLSPEELAEMRTTVLTDGSHPLVQAYHRDSTGKIAEVALSQLLITEALKRVGNE